VPDLRRRNSSDVGLRSLLEKGGVKRLGQGFLIRCVPRGDVGGRKHCGQGENEVYLLTKKTWDLRAGFPIPQTGKRKPLKFFLV